MKLKTVCIMCAALMVLAFIIYTMLAFVVASTGNAVLTFFLFFLGIPLLVTGLWCLSQWRSFYRECGDI